MLKQSWAAFIAKKLMIVLHVNRNFISQILTAMVFMSAEHVQKVAILAQQVQFVKVVLKISTWTEQESAWPAHNQSLDAKFVTIQQVPYNA